MGSSSSPTYNAVLSFLPGDLTTTHIWPCDNSNNSNILYTWPQVTLTTALTTARGINKPGGLNDLDNDHPQRLNTLDQE